MCINKIEKAIDKASILVPNANCHMLRARRLCDVLTQIGKFSKRIILKPHLVSQEDAREVLELSECDPLLSTDKEILFIRNLEPKLFSRAEIEKETFSSRRTKEHEILSTSAASGVEIVDPSEFITPPAVLASSTIDHGTSSNYAHDHAQIPMSLLQVCTPYINKPE